MEMIGKIPNRPVTAALFDFDGTISTLRRGWENVMEPMMVEMLGADAKALVAAFIDESTGIQTILQMKWLAEQIIIRKGVKTDPWKLKAEYNRRLMETVLKRRARLLSGAARREDFLIAGSDVLLSALKDRGVSLYVASGTDDPDVKAEAEILNVAHYFEKIAGAPVGVEGCTKEAVIRALLQSGTSGESLAVVGDGKVEIMVGRETGGRTLGVASDEARRRGIDEVKRRRLIRAGADAVVGDFLELEPLMKFFMGE